jgi:ParB family chromosome partitioning protein
MSTPKGLGKDFSALIPDDMLSEALAVGSSSDQIEHIALGQVSADPTQPRKHFDEQALQELAASIKQHGIVQPLIVAKKSGSYIIIAGERRYRAAQLAGLTDVPAIVRTVDEQEKLEVSLIENVQREDLSKLELAAAYLKLHDQFNLDNKAIGAQVGRSESSVVNIIRLLQLPAQAKTALNNNLISEGHARQIVALKTEQDQLALLELILKNNWTVRQAESYVVGHKQENKADDQAGAKALARTQAETKETQALAKRLDTKVTVKHLAKGGNLVIRYKDESHLEKLMSDLLG